MKNIYRIPQYFLASIICSVLATSAAAQGDLCDFNLPVVPGVYVADGPSSGFGASNGCYGSIATNSDWYSFTPANDGVIEVFSCAGTIDTRLSIFDGTCLNLNCVDFDDDGCLGSFASQVIGMPVTGGVTYYIEWDDYWTTSGFTWELLLHDCSAPEATFTRVNDCPNFQYSIDVDLTDLGSSAAVDIVNDGGAPIIFGATVGTYTVGPFASGSIVTINLVHDMDPFCDLTYGPVTNIPCPIVSCGPDNYTYCYSDNDTTIFVFEATSSDPLALQFNAGGMGFGDIINIYDGDNLGAPLLFAGDNGGDLSGVIAVSTNPGGNLLLQVVSTAFTSCQGGGVSPPWDWDVACLDCTQPTNTFQVIEDCIHKDFYVEVEITDLGDAGTVDIVNDIGIPPTLGVGLGTYQIGPIDMDNFVEVSVVHDLNPLCSIHSGDLIAYYDSCAIECSFDVYDYCYTNYDTAWFLYESGTNLPITMHFNSGKLAPDDQIVVYNGRTTTSAVLFNSINGPNMGGVTLGALNADGALLMRIYSDSINSCDDGAVSPQLEWSVSCGAVGIDEQDNLRELSIYPNPSSGTVTVQFDAPSFQEASFNILDEIGRKVDQQKVVVGPGSRFDMDLSTLESGMYLVQLEMLEGSVFKKVMIKH